MSLETFDVVVKRVVQETDRIKGFELAPVDGNSIKSFEPGGHIVIHMPDDISRHYSLVNGTEDTEAYRIGVLKEIDGRGGSAYMHDVVHEGAVLHVSGPTNLFELDETAKHSVLLAGGIGVTPIMAMAKHLNATDASFEMHYCAKSTDDAAFVNWLKSCTFADRVSFHFDGGDPSKGLNISQVVESQDSTAHIYFCGPAGFMDAIKQSVEAWEPERVHSESFTGVDAVGDHAKSFEIEINNDGKILTVPADKTALDVLRANGYEIESVCEEGVCGTCIVDVLEGIPEHRDEFLTDEEKEENAMMTTCCSRSKSSRLVIEI